MQDNPGHGAAGGAGRALGQVWGVVRESATDPREWLERYVRALWRASGANPEEMNAHWTEATQGHTAQAIARETLDREGLERIALGLADARRKGAQWEAGEGAAIEALLGSTQGWNTTAGAQSTQARALGLATQAVNLEIEENTPKAVQDRVRAMARAGDAAAAHAARRWNDDNAQALWDGARSVGWGLSILSTSHSRSLREEWVFGWWESRVALERLREGRRSETIGENEIRTATKRMRTAGEKTEGAMAGAWARHLIARSMAEGSERIAGGGAAAIEEVVRWQANAAPADDGAEQWLGEVAWNLYQHVRTTQSTKEHEHREGMQ